MCFEDGIEITEEDLQAGFADVEIDAEGSDAKQTFPVKIVGPSYRIIKCAINGQLCYKAQYFGIGGPRARPQVITGTAPQKLDWHDSLNGQFDSFTAAERHIEGDPDTNNTFEAEKVVNG